MTELETYIQECDCPEIQEQRHKVSDILLSRRQELSVVAQEFSAIGFLPTIDQLLEMLGVKFDMILVNHLSEQSKYIVQINACDYDDKQVTGESARIALVRAVKALEVVTNPKDHYMQKECANYTPKPQYKVGDIFENQYGEIVILVKDTNSDKQCLVNTTSNRFWLIDYAFTEDDREKYCLTPLTKCDKCEDGFTPRSIHGHQVYVKCPHCDKGWKVEQK